MKPHELKTAQGLEAKEGDIIRWHGGRVGIRVGILVKRVGPKMWGNFYPKRKIWQNEVNAMLKSPTLSLWYWNSGDEGPIEIIGHLDDDELRKLQEKNLMTRDGHLLYA